MYSGIRIVNPYTFVGNNFINWRIVLMYRVVFCCFFVCLHCVTDYADFQSYCGQYLFPSLSFSEIVSYVCSTVRFSCNILHSILGSPIS